MSTDVPTSPAFDGIAEDGERRGSDAWRADRRGQRWMKVACQRLLDAPRGLAVLALVVTGCGSSPARDTTAPRANGVPTGEAAAPARARSTHDATPPAPAASKPPSEEALREASEFGCIGLLGPNAPPPVGSNCAGPERHPTPEEIQGVIRAAGPRFKRCIEAHATAPGKIVTTFVIGVDGTTTDAAASDGDAPLTLERCHVDVFKSLTFPKPTIGKPITVVYPMSFRP